MRQGISFHDLARELSTRAARGLLSKFGIVNDALRAYLRERFESFAGESGSFLADPVFESMFGWERASCTMGELAGNLLAPALVDAMDAAGDDLRFGKEIFPYKHQVEAWKTLLGAEPRSVVVTSGTGSGKTECFVVPILNDLVRESEKEGMLVGVRALFLYPLNALINSQRDRLRAWTDPMKGKVRFCLYNGETPEEVPAAEQAASPAEVLSRKLLREAPPPILVTNATMLEYMLVRRQDAPIIEQSRGRLRWIVLDEAHTYVGSQAAELALLLRRVLHTFGVEGGQVRFVATSATIAKSGAEKAREELQRYLADIAGVPPSQVVVVQGRREIPALPQELEAKEEELPDPAELEQATSEARFDRLASSLVARCVRKRLAEGPQLLSEVAEALGKGRGEEGKRFALRFLDLACRAVKEEKSFLPLRGHFFHRTQDGLWACVDPACPERKGTLLDAEGWLFGALWFERRERCTCGALVFELALCRRCGAEYLAAEEERSTAEGDRRLQAIPIERGDDDLELHADAEYDEEDFEGPAGPSVDRRRLLGGHSQKASNFVLFDVETGAVFEQEDPRLAASKRSVRVPVQLPLPDEEGKRVLRCARCHERERAAGALFVPARAGSPFFLQVAMPTLLEQVPPLANGDGGALPMAGRRTITFTDSRQGTASFALRCELDGERDFVRSFIYHTLSTENPDVERRIAKLEEEIRQLEPHAATIPVVANMLEEMKREREELKCRRSLGLEWNELVTKLANAASDHPWWIDDWRRRIPGLDERGLAELMLYREFLRRPVRANSLETLGFVRVDYRGLEKVDRAPAAWREEGLGLREWKDFLKLGLDFVARARSTVEVPPEYWRWLGIPFRRHYLLGPDAQQTGKNVPRWSLPDLSGPLSRMARILLAILKRDPSDKEARGLARELLRNAWGALTGSVLSSMTNGYRLDLRSQLVLRRAEVAFFCPITRRLLDVSIEGVTPFLSAAWSPEEARTRSVRMPVHPFPFGKDPRTGQQVSPQEVEDWLASDSQIAELRRLGAWTEFSDRIARGAQLYVVREHSAQLSGSELRRIESQFKEGKVNLLSCSTTMEMGVDIGGLSVVGMNNAPPSPANFFQRAGRAGRRGEVVAASLTMCKATPHGEAVFRNPRWPFDTPIYVPRVSLDSVRIVMRHVHSLLLTRYFAQLSGELPKTNAGWFFGVEMEGGALDVSPADGFVSWLRETEKRLEDPWIVWGLQRLVQATGLEYCKDDLQELLERTATSMEELRLEWRGEWDALQDELARVGGFVRENRRTPAQKAMINQLRRMYGEYLLRELVERGFLPSHGFPQGVIPFINTTLEDLEGAMSAGGEGQESSKSETRDLYVGRRRGYPSRELPLAIREYAPGSEVTIDRQVYRSAGVTLNWRIPPTDQSDPQIQAIRWVSRCTECGLVEVTPTRLLRCECGASLEGRQWKFLRPAGFAVDIRDQPGNTQDYPVFIPVRRWISAGKSKWQPLPRPEAGRYRSSPDGRLFHWTSGLHGKGYAVCLHCGRAASEVSDQATQAMLPEELLEHFPLRRLRNANVEEVCRGSGNPYGIQRQLRLGGLERTDVFELQIRSIEPDTPIPSETALATIAVALRRAVAQKLGIDEREIGWAVDHARDGSERNGYSIYLFDTAAGGAGYVSLVGHELPKLLRLAREVLEACDCDKACHRCLLTFDTQFDIERLDRKAGLEVLSEQWLQAVELPEELKVFGPSTRLEWEPLDAAIRREARRVPTYELVLYLGGDAAEWDPRVWPLRPWLLQAAASSGVVRLVTTRCHLQKLEREVSNDLASLLEAVPEIELIAVEGEEPVPQQPGLIAKLRIGGKRLAWSTTHPASRIPAPEWADIDPNERIVFGEWTGPEIHGERIFPENLRKPLAVGWSRVDIQKGTDGPIDKWAECTWTLLLAKADEVAQRLDGKVPLAEVVLVDRYLRNPFQIRLAAEFLGYLARRKAFVPNTSLRVRTLELYSSYGPKPALWSHDWASPWTRDDVLEAVLESIHEKAFRQVEKKNQIPHSRSIELRWEDGVCWTLVMDEGVSFVAMANPVSSFDFEAPPEAQAKRILEGRFEVLRKAKTPATFWLSPLGTCS